MARIRGCAGVCVGRKKASKFILGKLSRGLQCRLDHGFAELRAVFTLFFIEHPALPGELLQRRSDLGKREGAGSQGNLFPIAVVAQVERDDAPMVLS